MPTRKPRGGTPDPDALAAFDAELAELERSDVAPPTLRAVPRDPEVTPELVEDAPSAPPKKRASSGGSSRSRKAKKTSLGETVGGLLGTLAGGVVVMASGRLAGPIVGPLGAMTPDEASSITKPLGNIVGRRAPKVILPGVPPADQADVEEIVATLLQWVARIAVLAVQRWGESQQARANLAANGTTTSAQATSAPRRENPRPMDAPPPSIPAIPTIAPDMAPRASDRPTDAPAAAAAASNVNAMAYTEALIAAGVGRGDFGEALTGF